MNSELQSNNFKTKILKVWSLNSDWSLNSELQSNNFKNEIWTSVYLSCQIQRNVCHSTWHQLQSEICNKKQKKWPVNYSVLVQVFRQVTQLGYGLIASLVSKISKEIKERSLEQLQQLSYNIRNKDKICVSIVF